MMHALIGFAPGSGPGHLGIHLPVAPNLVCEQGGTPPVALAETAGSSANRTCGAVGFLTNPRLRARAPCG